MPEVVPGGVGLHESPRHEQAGVIIGCQQERLLALGGPPLVDGTVMLPEFSDVGPAKASIAAFLPLGLQNKVWEEWHVVKAGLRWFAIGIEIAIETDKVLIL